MPERPLRILQVGTIETGGGAASVAGLLRRGYRARGCESWLAVGLKTSDDPEVFAVPDDDRIPFRATGYAALQRRLGRMAGRFPGRGWGSLRRSLRLATHPHVLMNDHRGLEDFDFPGTYRLLNRAPTRPDIVHCHNLHGGYFDLRALAGISQQVPTVVTLHDSWLLSGHCAHSFDCNRWKTGCGECPDLTIDPAIRRDATRENWLRKREIYAKCRLYIASPSQWLIDKVTESMLAPAVAEARVIPNGVDLSVFQPLDRRSARVELGLAPDAAIVLLTTGPHGSAWSDKQTLQAAIGAIAAASPRRSPVFIAAGHDGAAVQRTGADVRFVGYQADRRAMARYYQAADVYLHCARADTFPSAILEALACGTPVVATAVGGIPEQINPADVGVIRSRAVEKLRRSTGVLAPPGDAAAIADAVTALLDHEEPRALMSRNAVRDARERFDLDRQVECYLAWYAHIIDGWNHV